MSDFSSGVSRYIKARVTLEVAFPVDWNGRADISCYQCKFFSRNNGMCQLTKEVSEYPQKYIGSHCPLEEIIEENEND